MRSDKVNEILSKHKDNPLLDYVKDLWALIDTIEKNREYDRKQLVACRHKLAWKMYDKNTEDYDPEIRSYRPSKNPDANHSC
jgi:lauroyl/myristoyl acyltransferase